MKYILIINQKGGVGKTTIYNELAYSFERSGIPISTYDLDGQGGGTHETSKNPDAEYTLIDTPGHMKDGVQELIAQADLIIIPTIASAVNIKPFLRTYDAVMAYKKETTQVICLINQTTRYTSTKDFRTWLGKKQLKAVTMNIPQSEYFRQAESSMDSVINIAPKSAAVRDELLNVLNMIRMAAGCPIEG